jgi:hypothetical protein
VSAFPSDARRSPAAPEKHDIPDHRYNIAGSPSNCGDKCRTTGASCFFFTAPCAELLNRFGVANHSRQVSNSSGPPRK